MQAKQKTLVVFLPFLGASKSVQSKYVKLHESQGRNVLTRTTELREFLWPAKGLENSYKFLKSLEKKLKDADYDNVVIHSMSIGCYFYGLMLVNIRKHPQKFKQFVARAKVQIVESPVIGTLNEMATAIAISKFPKNRFKRRVLSGVSLSYFAVTNPFTVSVYNDTIEYFRSKSLPVASLIYTTEGDPMARRESFESLVEDWRKNHENVRSKVWVNSEHAGLLKTHPLEYTREVNNFVQGVLKEEPEVKLDSKL